MADVILRSGATKNLVHCKKNPSERRMRCFAPLSMKFRGGQPVQKDGGAIGIIPVVTQPTLYILLEVDLGQRQELRDNL